MKKQVVKIIIAACIAAAAGVSVAYCNTRSLGYSQEASVIIIEDDCVKILDYEIRYSDLENGVEKIGRYVPAEPVVVECAAHV